jgi:phospholipid/cholesterol/gamma-HCH transport system ATP-binding protein
MNKDRMNPAVERAGAEAEGSAISVVDLVTHYGDRMILKGVSVEVEASEIMVIMGGSGSGKSTLLRHMIGLEHPTTGTVRLLGIDHTGLTEHDRYAFSRRMGVAFQGGALISSMTVGQNIQLPLHEHTALDDLTIEIMARMKLEVVGLAGFEDLMPSELSGGMVKRAALARAMVMDPALLFCDEPSAGLDPVASSALDELIIRLREATGMTIVVVTHELDSAFRIADRITVLDQGEILIIGSVDEVRGCDNVRVQDLLQRRFAEEDLDPEAYLARLVGETL